ncbi:uncharacterized protein [Littorina saxatilis]|uniref:uncharacterized protein n=1 Tax=Littorina saxatilis TaxID=31220 RepID=UPI0038B5F735
MTFPEVDAPLRSDTLFDDMIDEEHHVALSRLEIGLVSHVVLDYMHLVCLGVMRRLIFLWMKGPLVVRQGNAVISAISDKLQHFKNVMPVEFPRKPRSLMEVARWKATEFRQFLLYTGLVALSGHLPDPMYKNFLLLSVAMHILLHPIRCKQYNNYAKHLLTSFVEHFAQLYGENMMVYNVHNLVHISDDAKLFGSLDNISAFPFENFMRKILKTVRKPSMPLQQVVKRFQESSANSNKKRIRTTQDTCVCKEHHYGIVPHGVLFDNQYKEVSTNDFCIKTNSKDNCVSFGNEIGLVSNILSVASNVWLVYQSFESVDTFFNYPCQSAFLGIFKVRNLSQVIKLKPIEEITSKNVILPYQQGFVVVPLCHSSKN